MKEGPDISRLAALIADPARANMLVALMSGKALTASELANEAGVTLQTASSHLKKLEADHLLSMRKQGRHRYFTLADPDIGLLLEALMGMAAKRGLTRISTGPRDTALQASRICYDHLAGSIAVQFYDHLVDQKHLLDNPEQPTLTESGAALMLRFGIPDSMLSARATRPLCRACLDWSERRSHLAGRLGAAILEELLQRSWATATPGSRIITFSATGLQLFQKSFNFHFLTPGSQRNR